MALYTTTQWENATHLMNTSVLHDFHCDRMLRFLPLAVAQASPAIKVVGSGVTLCVHATAVSRDVAGFRMILYATPSLAHLSVLRHPCMPLPSPPAQPPREMLQAFSL